MTSKHNLLVVGGAGFLGSHLVLALARAGHELTIVDDLSSGAAPCLSGASSQNLYERLIRLDLRDRAALEAVFSSRRFSAVFHVAGRHNHAEASANPQITAEVNLGGTAAMLSAMRVGKIDRLVVASDAAVLGLHPAPATESATPQPRSAYGRQMWWLEQLLSDAATAWGLVPTVVRLPDLIGASPRLEVTSALARRLRVSFRIAQLAARVTIRKPVPIPHSSAGAVKSDWLFVGDAGEAMARALTSDQTLLHAGLGAHWGADDFLVLGEAARGAEIPSITVSGAPHHHHRAALDSRLLRGLGWSPTLTTLKALYDSEAALVQRCPLEQGVVGA